MKVLVAEPKKLARNDYVRRSAAENDYGTLCRENVKIIDEDGAVKIIYAELNFDSRPLVSGLRRIRYDEGTRARGLKTRSRIVGYAPRLEMRQDYCHAASLATDAPDVHAEVVRYARMVEDVYSTEAPDDVAKHRALANKVLPGWRMDGSIFTSGIINKNNPLKYHFDTGNFKDVFSCMLGFKHHVSGGYLACPAYDCAFEIRNNSVLIFDGQNIMHGVTPIRFHGPESYRFTIVYYSLKRMWECLEPRAEINRIRTKRVDIEARRAVGDIAPSVRKHLDGLEKAQLKELAKVRRQETLGAVR